jgi:hypothetical protein
MNEDGLHLPSIFISKASHWLGNSTWHCLISLLNLILMRNIMITHQTFFMHTTSIPNLHYRTLVILHLMVPSIFLTTFLRYKMLLILLTFQKISMRLLVFHTLMRETVAWMDFLHSLQWVKQNTMNDQVLFYVLPSLGTTKCL